MRLQPDVSDIKEKLEAYLRAKFPQRGELWEVELSRFTGGFQRGMMMLTKYDEFLCHQIVSTFDHVETSAREWTERIWYSVHDTSGKLHLLAGFGKYLNRNIMDAFGSVAVEGKTQYTVRASRELRPHTDEVKVGPFSWEVIDPLKKVRCALGENDYGLSYDLEFEATMPATEEPAQWSRVRGREAENIRRFCQVGKPSGWIKVEGQTYHIDKETYVAERDRSWGIRRTGVALETGVQPDEAPEGFLYNWILVQFPKWGVSYHLRETWDGNPIAFGGEVFYPYDSQKEALKLASVKHHFELRGDIRQITSGRIVLEAVDGSKIELSVRPIGICYLKPGGYGEYQGFSHGLWMGPSFIDGVKLDITDPKVVNEVALIGDLNCEFRCGDEVGYGVTELLILGKYPRYGFEGY